MTATEPRTVKGWTHEGRCISGSRPSQFRAGDVYDSGYVVMVHAANMYWARPEGMRETSFATLDEARQAAQAHDQDVLAGRTPRRELHDQNRPRSELYRISRRVAVYRDPNTCDVQREAWGWVDLSSSASNAATFQVRGTDKDFAPLPAADHGDI